MALVVLTSELTRDAAGRPDPRPWTTRAATYQDGGGGSVITPGAKVTEWYPKAGELAIRLEAGVKAYIGNPDGREYLVTVPLEDGGLWEVIEAGQAYLPDTPQEQLVAAVSTVLDDSLPTAVASELDARFPGAALGYLENLGIEASDNGDGSYDLTLGGILLGTLEPAAAAVWSGIVGKPTVITADDVAVPEGIVEYRWISPASVYLPEPYRHTLLAALGNSDGTNTKVLIADLNNEDNRLLNDGQPYEIGTVPADDHNAPSVITAPGDPIVVHWTHHGLTDLMYYKVGLPDRPDTLVAAPLQTFDMGEYTSYGQAWKVDHLSDDEKVTYYRLYRRTLTEWYLLTEEVNRSTLVMTTDAPGVHLVTGNGSKPYCTTATGARDAQVVRLAIGTNPSDEADWVDWVEINLATGAITSPLDEAFTANLDGTNLPIGHSAQIQLLPNLSGAQVGHERRLLAARPWPAPMGLLTAEGDPANRAASRYLIQEWGGDYTEEDEGDPAASNGLIVPNGASPSYVKTNDITLANGASGIQVTVKLKLPASKPPDSWLDIAGQLNGASATSGWYIWLGATTNELRPRIGVNRVGNSNHNLSCPNPFSGFTWGDTVWLRVTYTVTASGSPSRRATFEQSPDGVTWTEIGYHVGASGALVVEPDAYTWIGGRSIDRIHDLVIQETQISIGGVAQSDIDFTSDTTGGWPGYETAYTDTDDNDWTLVGQATVGRTAYGPTIPPEAIPVSRDLGAIGGALWASYYPGAAFQGASVILARTNGANQELVLSHFVGETLQESVLLTQPTTEGKFFRPTPPDNGGPLWCWLFNATSYGTNEFYEWASSVIAKRRL